MPKIIINHITVIQHLEFEDLGHFQSLFESLNIGITVLHAGVDDIEQAIINAELVIVLGGPISIYQTTAYPFLLGELNAIKKRLAANQPTLGICLGAQLIAMSLDADVYEGETKEIGWKKVILNPAGLESPLSSLDDIPVLHWHGDTFDIPAKAKRLAGTDLFSNQAFSVGNNILALQFHVEVEPKKIEKWLIGHCCELSSAGIDPELIRQQSQQVTSIPKEKYQDVMVNWLGQLKC
jgi:GMP synthase (glutamine-hydrolysing)